MTVWKVRGHIPIRRGSRLSIMILHPLNRAAHTKWNQSNDKNDHQKKNQRNKKHPKWQKATLGKIYKTWAVLIMAQLLDWRGRGLWAVLQLATRGPSRCSGACSLKFLCRLSFKTGEGTSSHPKVELKLESMSHIHMYESKSVIMGVTVWNTREHSEKAVYNVFETKFVMYVCFSMIFNNTADIFWHKTTGLTK